MKEKKEQSCEDIALLAIKQFKLNNIAINFESQNCVGFPSKKNYVIKTNLIENNIIYPVIIKLFNQDVPDYEIRWVNEKKIHHHISSELKISNSFKLPELINSCPGIILYRFIPGKILLDLIVRKKIKKESLISLARCNSEIHSFGLIHGDNRLKNYILSENDELFIIDLEEAKMGEFIEDLPSILCSFIDFNPGIFDNGDISYQLKCMEIFLIEYLKISNINEVYNLTTQLKFVNFWVKNMVKCLEMISNRRKLGTSIEKWASISQILTELFVTIYEKNF
jgi:serine/threonine protein kinase